MAYCIYEVESTRFLRILRNGYWQDAIYKNEGAAKAGLKRHLAKIAAGGKFPIADRDEKAVRYAIAELGHFRKNIEKTEVKRNLISGKEFTQPVNTPASCDPSTETYWSM